MPFYPLSPSAVLMHMEVVLQGACGLRWNPYAEAIRRETGMPTMAVGAIRDGPQAVAILQRAQADLVAVAREALVDPHWALRAAKVFGVDPDWTHWPPYGWWLKLRQRTGIVE
jgi:2,4-dienoyl-CoA reductase-like NADH-dependent reductase (Old Yellow Enzyme family)